MKAWVMQFLAEAKSLIAAYPATVIMLVVLLIVIALIWVWFRVPLASPSSTAGQGLLSSVLQRIRSYLQRLWATLVEVVRQLLNRSPQAYDVPWYLIINPLEDKRLVDAFPISRTRRVVPAFMRNLLLKTVRNQWYFLKDMTLYDLSATSLGHVKQSISEISQRRMQRPLDGIVISLPVSQLMGANDDDLKTVTETLLNALNEVDQRIPFTLPVYVVLSECERIPGYQAFASQNPQQHNEIFGWSSDADLQEPYKSRYVDEAFSTMVEAIYRNQVVRSAQKGNLADADDYILIDRTLVALRAAIGSICNRLFEGAFYQNGYLFRGLYLIGQDPRGCAEDRIGDNLFLDDLLERKIAAEANLASPTGQGLRLHDRLLARYKRVSTFLLVTLTLVGTWNLLSLYWQFDNVSKTLEAIETPQLVGGSGYAEVYQVLDQLSAIDARNFSRLGLPISWFAGAEDRLVESISERQFGSLVFPAMECRVSQKFHSLLQYQPQIEDANSYVGLQWAFGGAWLQKLEDFEFVRHSFITLSRPSRSNDNAILEEFSKLILALYGIKPDDGFFQRNDLYRRALASLFYNYNASNPYCPNGSTGVDEASSELYWRSVNQYSGPFYTLIQESSLSPVGPLDITKVSTSSSAVKSGVNSLQGSDYVQIEAWFNYLEQMWIGNSGIANPCQQMYQRLTGLHTRWLNHNRNSDALADNTIALFDKQNCDDVFYRQLLRNQSGFSTAPFVQDAGGKVQFSPAVLAFRGNFSSVQSLSFMSVDTSKLPGRNPDRIVWDASRLLKALSYYQAYEKYAMANFSGLQLPQESETNQGAYALQSGILDQLRAAMLYELKWAQYGTLTSATTTNNTPADTEQTLLNQVRNFESVVELFYQLRSAFAQLGFQAERQAWVATTRGAALDILASSDQLVSRSRLYLPQAATDHTANNVMAALYGIVDANGLKDYLLAQRQRASFIAYNYSESAVTYLLNTDSQLPSSQQSVEQRWQQTLAQLNKYALKDPSNTLSVLEKQFSDALQISLDNCPSTVRIGAAEDIFTQSQTELMASIVGYCADTKDNTAITNYDWVITQFRTTLQGKYPFADVNTPNVQDASFVAVTRFFDTFDTFSADLLAELTAKAKVDASVANQRDFVQQLIDVSNFFAGNLKVEGGTFNGKLMVSPTFKLLTTPAIGEEQFISQGLVSNGVVAAIPGNVQQLEWTYGSDIGYFARLAGTSSYALDAPTNDASSVAGRTVRFTETGNWALLKLLQRYRSSPPSQTVKPNPGSIILTFPVAVKRTPTAVSGTTSPPLVNSEVRLLIGVDLYAVNPTTKQSELRPLPAQFPTKVPTL